MIDIQSETVISLNEAAKHPSLPRRRRGKRPHVSTLYRWSTAGIKGIKLETLRVGATLCTSLEAVQRFAERLTALDSHRAAENMRHSERDSALRSRGATDAR